MSSQGKFAVPTRFSKLRNASVFAMFSLALVGGPAAALAADTQGGSKLYAMHCAACHGNRGEGAMPGTPNFARANSLMQSDGNLLQKIKNGKNAMPGYYGILKEREILDVIAHLRTFN